MTQQHSTSLKSYADGEHPEIGNLNEGVRILNLKLLELMPGGCNDEILGPDISAEQRTIS